MNMFKFSVKYLKGKTNPPVILNDITTWLAVMMLAHHLC